jgi:thymidylate synthase (FAD)
MKYEPINVLDHGYVRLISHMGSDQEIIEDARMSTDGAFRGWGPRPCPDCGKLPPDGSPGSAYTAWHVDAEDCPTHKFPSGDEKLLQYMAVNGHTSPFEGGVAKFEVQAPIMVFRQWHRHRTQSYNEMSGRYVVLPDLYYVPSIERLMAGAKGKANKQGSESGITERFAHEAQALIIKGHETNRAHYMALETAGLSNELARLVLPVTQYSRMRATANLWNWVRFLRQRCDEHAQWEIRQYANAVRDLLSTLFPRSMALLMKEDK